MKILIINGPNLNLLGTREPEIYGSKTFDDYLSELQAKHPECKIGYFQSNIEGELIDAIQNAATTHDAIILNAAGYTHTSVAIGDSVAAIGIPVVEVHISNTFSREDFRHRSYVSPSAAGIIIGFGLRGYEIAINSILNSQSL